MRYQDPYAGYPFSFAQDAVIGCQEHLAPGDNCTRKVKTIRRLHPKRLVLLLQAQYLRGLIDIAGSQFPPSGDRLASL